MHSERCGALYWSTQQQRTNSTKKTKHSQTKTHHDESRRTLRYTSWWSTCISDPTQSTTTAREKLNLRAGRQQTPCTRKTLQQWMDVWVAVCTMEVATTCQKELSGELFFFAPTGDSRKRHCHRHRHRHTHTETMAVSDHTVRKIHCRLIHLWSLAVVPLLVDESGLVLCPPRTVTAHLLGLVEAHTKHDVSSLRVDKWYRLHGSLAVASE